MTNVVSINPGYTAEARLYRQAILDIASNILGEMSEITSDAMFDRPFNAAARIAMAIADHRSGLIEADEISQIALDLYDDAPRIAAEVLAKLREQLKVNGPYAHDLAVDHAMEYLDAIAAHRSVRNFARMYAASMSSQP